MLWIPRPHCSVRAQLDKLRYSGPDLIEATQTNPYVAKRLCMLFDSCVEIGERLRPSRAAAVYPVDKNCRPRL